MRTFFAELQDSFENTFFPIETMPKNHGFAFLFLGFEDYEDKRENSPTKGRKSNYASVVPLNHHMNFNGQALLLSPKAINTQIQNAVKSNKFSAGDCIVISYEGEKKSPQDASRTYKSVRLNSWITSDRMEKAGKIDTSLIEMYNDSDSDAFTNFIIEATEKNHKFLSSKGIDMDYFAIGTDDDEEAKEGSPDDLMI